MMGSVMQIPAVAEMCKKAEKILGYDLLNICVNGPKEKLYDTAFAQPALFVAGLAAVEKLRHENPEVVNRCGRVAGLSLGEYTTLVFAGSMSFEDGLKVVQIRAEAMKEAASMGDQGMLSVIGLDDATLYRRSSSERARTSPKFAKPKTETPRLPSCARWPITCSPPVASFPGTRMPWMRSRASPRRRTP